MLALNFCLPEFEASKFREALRTGEIDPYKLSDLSSAERRAFFEKLMDPKQAKAVNTLFESKLLLKNQQAGLINWAKQVGGLKPKTRSELIDRVNRMQEVLTPENEQAFLADLAEQKLGVGITMAEAEKIATLADKVASTKGVGDRLDYGRARVEFDEYVNDLKVEANSGYQGVGQTLVDVAGTAKAVKASLDNSAIFRQGWKTLMTNPLIWQKNARASFSDLVRTIGGKEVMKEIKADIVSRENYDLYRDSKLAVGTVEEAYPTALPGKVPGLGRLYKASETAYTGFVYKMRADVFDKYIEIAQKSGLDITDKALTSGIAEMVNSLTGRGSLNYGPLGNLEGGAKLVNNVFFSPRNLQGQLDLIIHPFTGAGGGNFVRAQAAANVVKVIAGTAAILVIADAVAPGSVEWDPRSSDFGKIKIGDTRFDVSGGMSSIAVLAARLATWESKSSTTGKVSPINSGKFGSKTGQDVFYNFFENKLSPAASVLEDILISGETFEGDKPTLANEAVNFAVPLPITNFFELRDNPKSANTLAAMLADALGIGTNTYSK